MALGSIELGCPGSGDQTVSLLLRVKLYFKGIAPHHASRRVEDIVVADIALWIKGALKGQRATLFFTHQTGFVSTDGIVEFELCKPSAVGLFFRSG
jgi:hypothetical protein